MRTIRVSRTRKYKKSKGLVIGFLVSSLCYLLIVSGVLLSQSTNALFNDKEDVFGIIDVNWESDDGEEDSWDKSSLSFIDQGGDCGNIWATIQNGKDSKGMEGPSIYEVYFAKKGNPKKGEKVGEGEVPPLESGETATITFVAEKNGSYKFKVYQRPGHPGKGELWSETINVTDCKKKKSEEPSEELGSNDSEEMEEKQAENNESAGNNESAVQDDSEQIVEEEEKTEEENREDEVEGVERGNVSDHESAAEEENESEAESTENEPEENNQSQETENEGNIGEQNP